MIISISILCVLGFVMLFGVQFAERGTFHDDSTSLEVSKGLQGICAICIILHHLAQRYDLGPISKFEYLGFLFVGIFFFFSGYGLIKSLRTKKNYLKGFLKKRLVTILVPTYICIFIYVIVKSLVWSSTSGWNYFFYLTGIHLDNSNMWFIAEIVILYLAFYFIFRFIKNEKIAFTAMGIFIMCLIAFSLQLGHCAEGEIYFKGEWWYNTTILFFVGMLIARFSEKIREFLKTPFVYYALTIGCIILACQIYKVWKIAPGYWTEGYSQNDILDKAETLLIQTPVVILFVFSVLLVSLKIKFSNKILRFLGSISLEIYLIHNVFLTFINGRGILIEDPQLFALTVICCSILAAFLIHLLSKFLINLILKPHKPKKVKKEIDTPSQEFVN